MHNRINWKRYYYHFQMNLLSARATRPLDSRLRGNDGEAARITRRRRCTTELTGNDTITISR